MKGIIYFLILTAFFAFAANLRAEDEFLDKGMAEFKAENYEEAIAFFLKAKETQPQSSVPPYYVGLIYKQLGNYSEAAAYLSEAVNLSPPIRDIFFDLADIYYNLGDFSKAKEWIKRAEDQNVRPANTAFLKGQILLRQGDNKEAIEAFKRAKETDKALEQAATFQIAVAYSNDRKLKEARDSFRAVITIDPSTDFATYAREYEKAVVRALESHKVWRFNVGASYQYDDNVLLKPSAAIPAVEITGETDNGIVASFRADYNPLLSGQWLLSGQYYLGATTYFRNSTHNLVTQNIALMPGYTFKTSAVTVPLTYTYVWLHGKDYMTVAAAKPTLNLSLSGGNAGQLSLGYSRRAMLQPSLDKDEDRDGDIFSASLGYIMLLAEGKGMLNLRYEFARDITNGKNWDNTGHKMNIAVLWPLAEAVKLTASGEAFVQDYKNINTVFGVKRNDSTYNGAVGLSWDVFKGLIVNLQYSHTNAHSNIAIYDYNRNVYTAGIEYNF